MSHRGVNIIDTLSYMQKKKKKEQHSTGFRSGPFRDHSGANSGMALFHQNKWSPEWQFWLGSLPQIIPLDSTGFRQESQGHDKDLVVNALYVCRLDHTGGLHITDFEVA